MRLSVDEVPRTARGGMAWLKYRAPVGQIKFVYFVFKTHDDNSRGFLTNYFLLVAEFPLNLFLVAEYYMLP